MRINVGAESQIMNQILLTVKAVRYGESPQNTAVFVGALIPSAKVPEKLIKCINEYEEPIGHRTPTSCEQHTNIAQPE